MKIKKYVMYPAAYLGIAVLMQSLVSWHAYFYAPPINNPYGLTSLVPIGLVGWAMIIGRVIDAVADPLVAYFSDNCRSKWGRRKPFLLFGGVPLVLSYILLWFPIHLYESMVNFLYLTIILGLYFIFFTVYVGPYLALLPQIGKTPNERAAISTYQSVFNTVGLLLQGVAVSILIINFGVQIMGIILGVLSLFTLVLPLSIKEDQIKESRVQYNLKDSFLLTLKNKQFRYYGISYLFFWFALNMLTISLPYIATELMLLDGMETALLQGIVFLNAILISPLILFLIYKKGKKLVYCYSMIIMAVLLVFLFFVGKPYLIFNAKWFGFVLIGMMGFPLASIFIIPNAMIADITDIDEAQNGQRREAMFYGVQGFVIKIIIGLSSLFTTRFLFHYFGYNHGDSLGLELVGFISTILMLAGLCFLKHYTLTEDQVKTIQVKLGQQPTSLT
ncbi:MAG: MFS transporter [Bacillota bacterium]